MRGRTDLSRADSEPMPWARVGAFIGAFLCMAPLFVLTVRGWANIVLFAGMLLCCAFLFRTQRPQLDPSQRPWVWALVVAMLAPFAAVFISSLLQADIYSARFDSPSRSLAGIPILLFVIRTRFDAARVLQYSLPAALAVTLGQQYFAPQPHKWGVDRMATYFADPLVFGYLSLAFGLTCLMSIRLRADERTGPPWLLAIQMAGFALGIYLSIHSGSRTGWLALPIVLAVWLHINWTGAKRGAELAVFAAAALTSALVYFLSDTVHTRVQLAVGDLVHYPWNGVVTLDTSVGLRITYLRMAWDIFIAHPLVGIGDTKSAIEQLTAFPYATPLALHLAFMAGFHNEVVTNTVRSGVWGGLAAIAILFVPLVIFARHLRDSDAVARRNAALGIAFSTCIVVSSLTTEVLDLKYTASFYAVMIALLCGATLARRGQDHR